MNDVSFVAGGGANFIGKTFYRLKLGGVNIGVDWGSGFPDGEPEYNGDLDYLFLTHCHHDHAGNIPRVFNRFPGIKVFTHPATLELAKVSWMQTLYRAREKENGYRPPFTFEEIRNAEKSIIMISDGEEIKLNDDIVVYPIRAGHILGSVSLLIVYKEEIYFFTGDICFQDRTLIKGAPRIDINRSKLLVRESTYINETFEDREKIKAELIDRTKAVLNRNGQLLIAALSIDRAQDIFSILWQAGVRLVYIDGPRKATDIYRKYLGSEILKEALIFKSRSERQELIKRGAPAVVIASSGMIHENTLSAMWAGNFMFRENNAIFTVNYQDPSSQGYILKNSKRGQFIRFNKSISKRMCEIGHFNMSAHIDKIDGEELEERLNPDVIIYTHGEDKQIDEYMKKHQDSRTRIKSIVGKEVEL